jgi:hypothetical protein
MAIIVRHRSSPADLVLLGPGYAAYLGMREGAFTVKEDSGELYKVAVCDGSGAIRWFDSKDVTVVEIDGMEPAAVLDARKQRAATAPS